MQGARRTDAIRGRGADAAGTAAASETIASPPELNPNPYGAVPVEAVCRSPVS